MITLNLKTPEQELGEARAEYFACRRLIQGTMGNGVKLMREAGAARDRYLAACRVMSVEPVYTDLGFNP